MSVDGNEIYWNSNIKRICITCVGWGSVRCAVCGVRCAVFGIHFHL